MMADVFLGITLTKDFTEEVEHLRRRFAAPRTAPHITLIPPFTWPGSDEELEKVIRDSIHDHSSFSVTAKGLGRFGRGVIYIDVTKSPELMELYGKLKDRLQEQGVKQLAKGRPYHPHITLATRLSPGEFHKYMEELSDYSPVREFTCQEVALFRMEARERSRRWRVVRQIPLR